MNADSWQRQSDDRVQDCLRIASERDRAITQHATTLRLLEEIDAEIQGAMNNAFPEDAPDILDAIGAKIRAHLAALSKPSAMQQYAKQEGRQ